MSDYQLRLPTGILKAMNLLETVSTYFSSKNSESRRHFQIVTLLFWGKTAPSRVKKKRKRPWSQMTSKSTATPSCLGWVWAWLSLSRPWKLLGIKSWLPLYCSMVAQFCILMIAQSKLIDDSPRSFMLKLNRIGKEVNPEAFHIKRPVNLILYLQLTGTIWLVRNKMIPSCGLEGYCD